MRSGSDSWLPMDLLRSAYPVERAEVSANTREYAAVGVTLQAGIASCQRKEWHAGLHYLLPLVKSPPAGMALPGLVYSYAGHALARTEHRYRDALSLFILAVEREFFQPENWLNLAWVHLLSRNRQECLKALKRGLAVSPTHRGLRALARRIGERRPPVLRSLSRGNPVNVWLGRRRHERETAAALV